MKSFEPVVSNLPYNLPNTVDGQLKALSEKIGIPNHITQGLGQKGINILCGIIIYRHLSPHQKQDVMVMIHATKNPKIIGFLTTKIVDTLINPDWGIWSRSTSELEEAKEYYKFVADSANLVGISLSITSFKEFISTLWAQKKFTAGGILIIAVWLGVMWNNSILNGINTELDNRKQFIKKSSY